MVLPARALPEHLGVQPAELTALTQAHVLAENQTTNIHIDSNCPLGAAFATGLIWKERRFLTLAGQKIAHQEQILDLLRALEKSKLVAVLYCKAIPVRYSDLTKGNSLADSVAEVAALQPLQV